MAGYKPYPEYKDSGAEWFREVPGHWFVKRLKFLVTAYGGGTPNTNKPEYWDGDIPWVSPKDMKAELVTETEDYITALGVQESSTQLVPVDSVLMVVRSGILRHSIPVSRNKVVVALNQDMKALITNDHLLSSYLQRFMQGNQKYLLNLWRKSGCTVESIEYGNVANTEFAIPPVKEQKAIVRFLDYKTGQIDVLIAKKQTLLERLAEKRTALISHAVTKGLSPNARMKNSGIEWLGHVPEHWHVSKLSFIATSLQTGPFGSQLHADDYIEGGVPLINPADIVNGQLIANIKNTVNEDVVERLSRHVLELGDIVIARRGEMGRAAVVTERSVGWLCGTGSLRARVDESKIISGYLLKQFRLHGLADYLSLQSVGSTMENLNTSILGRLPVLLPPIQEQREILLTLNRSEDALNKQMKKVGCAIEKLKEYRAALITQAVTGKIDVRHIKIPEAAPEEQAA